MNFPPQDVSLPCHDEPDLFFPKGFATARDRAQVAEAKAICATCPFKAECLAYAIATGDVHSVAGGTTPNERHAVRRGRLPGCGTRAGYSRHRRLGERACVACQDANTTYKRNRAA